MIRLWQTWQRRQTWHWLLAWNVVLCLVGMSAWSPQADNSTNR